MTSTILYGDKVERNQVPPISNSNISVSLPGKIGNNHSYIELNSDMLSKHFLLIGATGSGKTNVFFHFVDQLKRRMTKDDVMIIFDTKGDYYSRFFSSGDLLISNSKYYSEKTAKWNIYKELVVDGWDAQALESNTYEVAQILFRDAIDHSNQPFFPNAAKDLFSAILTAHLRLGEDDLDFKKQFFNNKALRFYFDSSSPDRLHRLLAIDAFADLSSVLTYIGDGRSDQALGVLAELQNVVRQIFVGAFAQDGRFSIREFVRNKGARTLFVEYDLSIGSVLSPLYRLFFDLALKEAMGRNKSEGNVYLVCDEFKLLPNLQHIEDGVNFGRSLGVKVLAGIQSIEQLFEIYGESKGKNIASGFSSTIAFKANDATTRDYISALHGKNMVLEQYRTATNMLIEEKREGHSVEDWDLINLDVGDAIVGLPFKRPFRFHFDLYGR